MADSCLMPSSTSLICLIVGWRGGDLDLYSDIERKILYNFVTAGSTLAEALGNLTGGVCQISSEI